MRGDRQLADAGLLDLGEEGALAQVLVGEQRLRVEDGREGDAQLLGAGQQVLPVVLGQVRAQDLLELLPLDRAQPEVREQRVVLQLRLLDQDRHHQREAGGAADHDDVAVAAGEDLAGVGRDVVARVEALADRAEVGVHRRVVFVRRAQRLQARDVDVLACAGLAAVLQRGEDRDPGVQRAEVLGRLAAGAERLLVGVAGDVHQAGQRHRGERVALVLRVRAGLPERRHRAVDEVREVVA